MAETKISDIIGTSLEKIRELADTETVIGEPILTAGGTTIVPVSKISMGFASGGLDYNPKNKPSDPAKNFGGGGGTGMTITPIAFLIIYTDGRVEILPLTQSSAGAPTAIDKISSIIDRTPDLFAKIKAIFSKKSKKNESEENEEDSDASVENEVDEDGVEDSDEE